MPALTDEQLIKRWKMWAGAAADEVYTNWNDEEGWNAHPPVSVILGMISIESSGDNASVSADGQHVGLGNVGIGQEVHWYNELMPGTEDDITRLDQLYGSEEADYTNLKVMAVGLLNRHKLQGGDWYAAAATYAGFADDDGKYDPEIQDEHSKVTGRQYYDHVRAFVREHFPEDAEAIENGQDVVNDLEDSTGVLDDLFGGAKKKLGDVKGGITGGIIDAGKTVGIALVAVALIGVVGFATAHAVGMGRAANAVATAPLNLGRKVATKGAA